MNHNTSLSLVMAQCAAVATERSSFKDNSLNSKVILENQRPLRLAGTMEKSDKKQTKKKKV